MKPLDEITIRLDPATAVAVNHAIALGRFSSPAEVLGEALQDWLARSSIGLFDELTLEDVEAGFDEDAGTDSDVVLARLEASYIRIVEGAAAS
jgi:Arc/MetJ-type ribon-helix-helix transcriptional regulator